MEMEAFLVAEMFFALGYVIRDFNFIFKKVPNKQKTKFDIIKKTELNWRNEDVVLNFTTTVKNLHMHLIPGIIAKNAEHHNFPDIEIAPGEYDIQFNLTVDWEKKG